MLSRSMEEVKYAGKTRSGFSQSYLAMANWSQIQPGLEGVAEFFLYKVWKNGYMF